MEKKLEKLVEKHKKQLENLRMRQIKEIGRYSDRKYAREMKMTDMIEKKRNDFVKKEAERISKIQMKHKKQKEALMMKQKKEMDDLRAIEKMKMEVKKL